MSHPLSHLLCEADDGHLSQPLLGSLEEFLLRYPPGLLKEQEGERIFDLLLLLDLLEVDWCSEHPGLIISKKIDNERILQSLPEGEPCGQEGGEILQHPGRTDPLLDTLGDGILPKA